MCTISKRKVIRRWKFVSHLGFWKSLEENRAQACSCKSEKMTSRFRSNQICYRSSRSHGHRRYHRWQGLRRFTFWTSHVVMLDPSHPKSNEARQPRHASDWLRHACWPCKISKCSAFCLQVSLGPSNKCMTLRRGHVSRRRRQQSPWHNRSMTINHSMTLQIYISVRRFSLAAIKHMLC